MYPRTQGPYHRCTGKSHLLPVAAALGHSSISRDQKHCKIEGVFIRDEQRSDMVSYEKMTKLMNLGKLQTMTAVRLIEGIELRWDQDRSLELSFLTVIPFFQVRERYAIGQRVQNQRRDLRFGSQLGLVTVDGCWTLELSSTWGEPYSGALRERFTAVDENGTLEVESTLCIGAKEEKATLIYQKMDAWVPRHKWNPLAMLNPHSFQI